jgi:malto-oligosyltrehalose trehalohydrolase
MSLAARFGAQVDANGVRFRLWAPGAGHVDLMLERAHPMQACPGGWFELAIPGGGAGLLYKYRIDGELEVPDPASHYQPQDVAGPSEVIDHRRYRWRSAQWRGRPWRDAVFLELHVGAFTPAGTFSSAIEKLDHLAATGITAIELMPLAEFAGRWNWGYDGVLLYAPDSSYGRPDDLRALIDAAHSRGLMVFLDVVYNHFGPEGNYLHRYAPNFFAAEPTPWGAAINYRVPQVRAFAIGNALHWLESYRFDGLRLDAVHAISEPGEPSILHDLSCTVGRFAAASGRQIHLVLENDDNQASLLDPAMDPSQGKFRAQWNDDYHHAWHVLLTDNAGGYYRDYAGDVHAHLARALRSGFAYQGEASAHRRGRPRGEKSGEKPPLAFVNFLQNHDQIGNRPLGDRLVTQASGPALAAALAITLLAPMPPLLFMGEEWGSARPFPFFCDFSGPLADAVRNGRREEFKEAYADLGGEIPDPLAESTFRSAALDWQSCEAPAGRQWLGLVRDLLLRRQQEITPALAETTFSSAACEHGILTASWRHGAGGTLDLLANLSPGSAARPRQLTSGRPIWGGEPPAELPPWSVFWSIGQG